MAVDKLPAWVMSHSPRSTEPSPRCRILRGRRILLDSYVHQAEWTTAEVAEAVGVHRTVTQAHLERLVALGTWCQVSDEARLANPPSCTGSPSGKSEL